MNRAAGLSFFEFVAGFLFFITLSFGITFAVGHYTQENEAQQAAAVARALMLQQ